MKNGWDALRQMHALLGSDDIVGAFLVEVWTL